MQKSVIDSEGRATHCRPAAWHRLSQVDCPDTHHAPHTNSGHSSEYSSFVNHSAVSAVGMLLRSQAHV